MTIQDRNILKKMKAKIFIGSSVEGLDIAYAIQENLEYDHDITVWSQGIFNLSSYALIDLLNIIEKVDYAIMVFNPDDVVLLRDKQVTQTRDNVIFELGLFISKLGKDNVFYVKPRTSNNLHLPSDLLGLNVGTYNNVRDDENLNAALGPFCNQIKKAIKHSFNKQETAFVELKGRRSFERMEKIIEYAKKEVIISGINLEAAVNIHQLIKAKSKKGINFKLLALKPNSNSIEISSKLSNVDPEIRRNKIISNLDLLRSKLDESIIAGSVEIKVYDGILPTGCIGIDLEENNGFLIAQHYLYNTPPDFAPLITLKSKENYFWYEVYKKQLLENWTHSEKL